MILAINDAIFQGADWSVNLLISNLKHNQLQITLFLQHKMPR